MDGDKGTLVDAESMIEGKLTGKDARILGTFQGEIQLSGRLQLGEGSKVEAKVRAGVAEIAGDFKGELFVQSLVLLEKARVEGTIEANSLAIKEGAMVNGSVNAGAQRARPPALPPPPKPPVPGASAG